MHPDREAFIAGIAADPANDLRRLVFADWLEENGEPERAEFVRLQIEAATEVEAVRRADLHLRVGELFGAHGPVWLRPFFAALDPQIGQLQCGLIGPVTRAEPAENTAIPYVRSAVVARGFVGQLSMNLIDLPPPGGSVGEAARWEPVTDLAAVVSADRQAWSQFTEPALRHLKRLSLFTFFADYAPAGMVPVFADTHLAGVRAVTLQLLVPSNPAVPVAVVRAFAGSPLAYRLEELHLSVDDDGLRALARSDRLRLNTWTISGTITATGVRPLVIASTAPALRSLTLNAGLDDEAVAALARGERFVKLNELDLSGNRFTDAGLRALAAARFAPQLETLDISGCELGDPDTAPGLRALADALNPDRLKRLRLAACGFDTPPEFLTARFGDRVMVV